MVDEVSTKENQIEGKDLYLLKAIILFHKIQLTADGLISDSQYVNLIKELL